MMIGAIEATSMENCCSRSREQHDGEDRAKGRYDNAGRKSLTTSGPSLRSTIVSPERVFSTRAGS